MQRERSVFPTTMLRVLRRKCCTNIQILLILLVLFLAPIYFTFEHSSMECQRATRLVDTKWRQTLEKNVVEYELLKTDRNRLKTANDELVKNATRRNDVISTQPPTAIDTEHHPRELPEQAFVARFTSATNDMEHLIKSKLQFATRASLRNVTQTRSILSETITDMSDIRFNLVHELNMYRVRNMATDQPREDQPHPDVDAMIRSVYSTFLRIQNPVNCQKARRLICDINKPCGFACQIHHVAYCLVVAYALERTLEIQDRAWTYAPGAWRSSFLPWSDTCQAHWAKQSNVQHLELKPWDNSSMKSDYLHCSLVETLRRKPDFLPPAVPRDIGFDISSFHKNPFIWWIGQIIAFLMRPSERMREAIEKTMERIGFWGPIVGIHIRHIEKQKESYPVKTYFRYAEEYFRVLRLADSSVKPRVYLATDNPAIVIEAKDSYPDFDVLYVEEHVDLAAESSRYNQDSLQALIIDTFLLANTDFIICTLSSQICRLAYELLQTYHTDGSYRVVSLEQNYHFGGQTYGAYTCTHAHKSEDPADLHLEVGDEVFVREKHGGRFYGMNTKTGQFGSFPVYKVQETVKLANFPNYAERGAVT